MPPERGRARNATVFGTRVSSRSSRLEPSGNEFSLEHRVWSPQNARCARKISLRTLQTGQVRDSGTLGEAFRIRNRPALGRRAPAYAVVPRRF
jgi:hypothetical protein